MFVLFSVFGGYQQGVYRAGSLSGGGFLGIAVDETVVSNLLSMGCQGSEVVSLQVSRGRGLGEYLRRWRVGIEAGRRPILIEVHGI